MRMRLIDSLRRRRKLDYVVVRHIKAPFCHGTVYVSVYDNGKYTRQELLRKGIPFWFILAVKMLHLGVAVVVEGFITKEELESEREVSRRNAELSEATRMYY